MFEIRVLKASHFCRWLTNVLEEAILHFKGTGVQDLIVLFHVSVLFWFELKVTRETRSDLGPAILDLIFFNLECLYFGKAIFSVKTVGFYVFINTGLKTGSSYGLMLSWCWDDGYSRISYRRFSSKCLFLKFFFFSFFFLFPPLLKTMGIPGRCIGHISDSFCRSYCHQVIMKKYCPLIISLCLSPTAPLPLFPSWSLIMVLPGDLDGLCVV